jgi:hypothetical protein
MAKTQLNLELSYKGKILDYIKNGSGVFKDKWFVGSNKYLLWQILDPAFPDKHQLIAQKGNDFFMKLVPGTKLECSKAGKQVDQAFLSSNGLLKGDQLQLQNDMSGTLVLNPDWQIHYRFIEPYVHILTEEERQIVAQYSRRAESSAEEKLGRGMILVFLFLTLALLVLYDLVLKPDAVDAATLDNTLAQLRKAQRVDMPDRSQDEADMQGDEAAERPAEKKRPEKRPKQPLLPLLPQALRQIVPSVALPLVPWRDRHQCRGLVWRVQSQRRCQESCSDYHHP